MSFIDRTLLDATEYLCRRFQALTGRTNVWIAVQLTNLSIVVYFVWAGLYALNVDVELRVVAAIFCVIIGLDLADIDKKAAEARPAIVSPQGATQVPEDPAAIIETKREAKP